MKSTYYEYLKTLPKEELVSMIYKPFTYRGLCPVVSQRKVALRISYDGSKYRGTQRHKFLKSVGDCLQNALELSKLGPYGDKNKIVFCGRTDAGVSAVSMVASLVVGSHLRAPNHSFEQRDDDFDEYPYDVILNQLLPESIRVTGWAPAPEAFDARYDCVQRHYRYLFISDGLDLEKMKEAADRILEMDDFYLLSTHSNPKAVYRRKIDEMNIFRVDEGGNLINVRPMPPKTSGEGGQAVSYVSENQENTAGDPSCSHESKAENNKCKQEKLKSKNPRKYGGDLCCLDIKARGFLHNMVRKVFWVVQNCGKGNPFSLTNVEIADPHPLVFVGARFRNKLNFMSNRYNEPHFRKEEEYARIQHAISKLRLDEHDRSGIV